MHSFLDWRGFLSVCLTVFLIELKNFGVTFAFVISHLQITIIERSTAEDR